MTVINLTSDDVSGFKKSDFDMIKTQINGLDTSISIDALFAEHDNYMIEKTNKIYKLSNERAIISGAYEIPTSNQQLIDLFSDVDGINNTINTTNTDAVFDTSYYLDKTIPDTNNYDELGKSLLNNTDSSDTTKYGMTGHININCYCNSITKSGNSTATKAYIYEIDGSLLGSADFSGNIATFTTPIYLKAGSEYTFVADKAGGIYTYAYDTTGLAYPYNNTYVNFIGYAATNNNGGTGEAINILSINISPINYINSILESVSTIISSGKTKTFITPLLHEELAAGDSITADISLDGGTTYTTNIPINEWTDITSTDGTSLIAKLNLNTGDGTTTPKVKGWSVLLE